MKFTQFCLTWPYLEIPPIKRVFCLEALMWVLNNLQQHIQITQSTEVDPIKSFIQSRTTKKNLSSHPITVLLNWTPCKGYDLQRDKDEQIIKMGFS